MTVSEVKKLIQNSKIKTINTKSYLEIKDIVKDHIDSYLSSKTKATKEELSGEILNFVLKKLTTYYIEDYMVSDDELDTSKLSSDLIDDIIGYGILTKPIQDDKISEIRGNGRWIICVDNKNRSKFLEDSNGRKIHFKSVDEQKAILNQKLNINGTAVNSTQKLVNTLTPEGYRLSMTDPSAQSINNDFPQENDYISFTLRKFKSEALSIGDLVKLNSLSDTMAKLCKILIYNTSIAVVGPVFAGKTTFLRALNDEVPDMIRLISIQQPSEQDLRKYNDKGEPINDRVMMEADEDAIKKDKNDNLIRYSNTLSNSTIHTLRNSPTIVNINEIRHPDEFSSAVQIGQSGSLLNLTYHASNAEEACSIGTNKLIASTNQDYTVGLKDITFTFKFVIALAILGDGRRIISEISELCGVDPTNPYKPIINTIYKYKIDGVEKNNNGTIKKIDGHHEKVGKLSEKFIEQLSYKGIIGQELIDIDPDIENYNCSYTGKV